MNNTRFLNSYWITIWNKPRDTVNKKIHQISKIQSIIFFILSSFSSALYLNEYIPIKHFSTGYKLLIGSCFIKGIISGLIYFLLGCKLIEMFGKKIGGKASLDEIQKSLSIAQIPLIYAILLHIFKIILFKKEIFMGYTPIIDSSIILSVILRIVIIIDIILIIKQFLIVLNCLSEVQGFSKNSGLGKSAKNIVSVYLFVIICKYLMVMLLNYLI